MSAAGAISQPGRTRSSRLWIAAGAMVVAGGVVAATALGRDDRSAQGPAKEASASMKREFFPAAAFRAHAAKVLKISVEDVEGGANDAEAAALSPHNVGGAWAYSVRDSKDVSREVRGWVTVNGIVVTPEQNLATLFHEAGAWDSPRTLTQAKLAHKIAHAIVWSYGLHRGHQLVTTRESGMVPPELALTDIGPLRTGTLRFFSSYQRPGPGGAGGGPIQYFENRIVLESDERATLTKTPFEPRP